MLCCNEKKAKDLALSSSPPKTNHPQEVSAAVSHPPSLLGQCSASPAVVYGTN